MERRKLLFIHFKAALTEMFHLRRTDLNTYWKGKSSGFFFFLGRVYLSCVPSNI